MVSHDSNSLISIPVNHSTDILKHIEGLSVVGIDEVNSFLMKRYLKSVNECLKWNKGYCRWIRFDFKGHPFNQSHMLAIAEYVTKLHAYANIAAILLPIPID